MNRTSRGRDAASAARAVLAWVRFYTRDIASAEARARREELESDVWEQLADPVAAWGTRSASLLGRAVRGAPSDLLWRSRALRSARPASESRFARWERGGLGAVVTAQGIVVSGVLAVVVLHLVRGGNAGSLGGDRLPTVAVLLVALAAAVLGFRLLLDRSTRWIGSMLVGGAAAALLVIGGHAMVRTSTTVAAVYYSTPFLSDRPNWSDLLHVALVVLGLFHLAVASSWLPERRSLREVRR